MTRAELLQIAKPILFNSEMVRAILEGRKSCTRRVIKPQPQICCADGYIYDKIAKNLYCKGCGNPFINSKYKECMSKYQVGDYLYVRETWAENNFGLFFRADYPQDNCPEMECNEKWRPSIHMPKVAARIFLRVTDVRVERLQDITNDDCHKEGIDESGSANFGSHYNPRKYDFSIEKYHTLWDTTIKPADIPLYGWGANPWVWAIEFERVKVDERS